MIPNYQVRFKDANGNVTHVLPGGGLESGGMVKIECETVVNGTGSHSITLAGDLSLADDIGLDYQVEVWRRPTGIASWALAYEGFHRAWSWKADDKGSEQFTSTGVGYNSLLARRTIASYAGTAEASKTGPAETVIKAFVSEQAGALAAANRRISGLGMEYDLARGNTWTGDRAWKVLLEVCQEIAFVGGGDFQVVGIGPAQFEFRWYPIIMGVDRTIGSATPVVFSPQRNNMLQPVLDINHMAEYNCMYMTGSGEGQDRKVIVIANADAIVQSPWNRIESVRQATQEGGDNGLVSAGVAELRNGLAQTTVGFTVGQTVDCAYGVHYFLGDLVSALYRRRVDRKIVQVKLTVDASKEDISIGLADVIR